MGNEKMSQLMDKLIKAGITFEDLSAAYDDAYDRYTEEQEKEKNRAATAEARSQVINALSAYVELVYGTAMDDVTKKTLEKDFMQIEKIAEGVKVEAKMEKTGTASDDERIRAWISKML